jgi:Tfp pilus assembly protein PilN
MKAVNLIPTDERRRASGTGSGVGAYVLLAALALLVAAGAAYALANRSLSDRRAELASVQSRAQASAAEIQSLDRYTSFAALSAKRADTVRTLARSRFDWSQAMHEVSRTLPSYAWLTSMRATVTPSATVEGGSTDPLRAALATPAIELIGCTTTPQRVAAVISNLRRVDGVRRVSLSSAAKGDTAGSGAAASDGASSASGDCRHGNARFPQFSLTLFFNAPAGAGAPTAGAAATPATPAPATGAPATPATPNAGAKTP